MTDGAALPDGDAARGERGSGVEVDVGGAEFNGVSAGVVEEGADAGAEVALVDVAVGVLAEPGGGGEAAEAVRSGVGEDVPERSARGRQDSIEGGVARGLAEEETDAGSGEDVAVGVDVDVGALAECVVAVEGLEFGGGSAGEQGREDHGGAAGHAFGIGLECAAVGVAASGVGGGTQVLGGLEELPASRADATGAEDVSGDAPEPGRGGGVDPGLVEDVGGDADLSHAGPVKLAEALSDDIVVGGPEGVGLDVSDAGEAGLAGGVENVEEARDVAERLSAADVDAVGWDAESGEGMEVVAGVVGVHPGGARGAGQFVAVGASGVAPVGDEESGGADADGIGGRDHAEVIVVRGLRGTTVFGGSRGGGGVGRRTRIGRGAWGFRCCRGVADGL